LPRRAGRRGDGQNLAAAARLAKGKESRGLALGRAEPFVDVDFSFAGRLFAVIGARMNRRPRPCLDESLATLMNRLDAGRDPLAPRVDAVASFGDGSHQAPP
jgi:hypothetical protein